MTRPLIETTQPVFDFHKIPKGVVDYGILKQNLYYVPRYEYVIQPSGNKLDLQMK